MKKTLSRAKTLAHRAIRGTNPERLELAVLAACTVIAAIRGDWHAMMATAMLISKTVGPQARGAA